MKNQKIKKRPIIANINEKIPKLGGVKKTNHSTNRMVVIIVSLVCLFGRNVD